MIGKLEQQLEIHKTLRCLSISKEWLLGKTNPILSGSH